MILIRRMIAWIAGFLGLCLVVVGLSSDGPLEGKETVGVGLFMLIGGIIVDFYLQGKRKEP